MISFDSLPSPDDPEEALAAVLALKRLTTRLEQAAVRQALAQGWSYAEVAQALGVTKQAVHKKHAKQK